MRIKPKYVVGERKVPKVVLLPWTHSFEYERHEKIIEYLRNLPRNSVLAVESTPLDLELLYKNLNDFKAIGRLSRNPMLLAMADVVFECRKRNIRVIPIESPVLHTETGRTFKRIDYFQDVSDLRKLEGTRGLYHLREMAFARGIVNSLLTLRRSQLYVLTGSGHTAALYDILKSIRVPVKIDTSMYPNPRKATAHLRLHLEKRKLIDKNELAGRNRVESELLSQSITRSMPQWALERDQQFREDLKARRARTARKLQERKAKGVRPLRIKRTRK